MCSKPEKRMNALCFDNLFIIWLNWTQSLSSASAYEIIGVYEGNLVSDMYVVGKGIFDRLLRNCGYSPRILLCVFLKANCNVELEYDSESSCCYWWKFWLSIFVTTASFLAWCLGHLETCRFTMLSRSSPNSPNRLFYRLLLERS